MSVEVICLLLVTILNNVEGTEFTTNNETRNVPNNRYKREEFTGWQFIECVLPPHPENGKWEVISGSGTPGSAIPPNTLVQFSCNSGFNMEPETEYFICDTDWDPSKMPRCIENLCPPLSSSSVKFVKCFNSTGNRIECSRVSKGGYATTKCAPFHELSREEHSTIHCHYKTWSEKAPECNVVCGQAVKEQELQTTYMNKNIPKYPWIATVFVDNYQLYPICSGSLISTSHVLTAAHCVVNRHVDNNTSFQIAAGKTFQEYGNPRDILAQYVAVADMLVHPDYGRLKNDRKGDIAVLKTKRPFRLSPLVQPICIRGLIETHPSVEDKGVIAVWGIQEDRSFTEDVQYLENTLNQTECSTLITQNKLRNFFIADKMCMYFENDKIHCSVGGGAGFAVKKPDNNRFFIQGILIICVYPLQTTNICVKTWYHYHFIIDAMEKL